MSLIRIAQDKSENGDLDVAKLSSGGEKYFIVTGDLGGGTISIMIRDPDGNLITMFNTSSPTGKIDISEPGAYSFPGIDGLVVSAEMVGATGANFSVWVTS